MEPRAEGSVNKVSMCVRDHYGSDYIHHPDRLFQPHIRKDRELVAVSWQEALEETVGTLQDLAKKYGPQSIGFFDSVRCTNEENYLFPKLARLGIGTRHVDNGARFSGASSLLALNEELGVPGSTHPLEEIDYARVILVAGC